MSLVCRICGALAANARKYDALEMMFGTKESFRYFECPDCGCLQIGEIPRDLSRFYPSGYYSGEVESRKKVWIKSRRLKHDLGEISLVGAYFSRVYGADPCAKAIALGKIGRTERIVDVGGGVGRRLRPLLAAGFRNLLSLDPFVQREIDLDGLQVRRARLQDVDDEFRLIMMHHSFEHMPDPHEVLDAAAKRLAEDGVLLVRIPLLGYGWRTYGVNWVELDAPRHIYLHTRDSFERLARCHGFEVVDVTFDSTEMEIWGSEQYVRGIAHTSSES